MERAITGLLITIVCINVFANVGCSEIELETVTGEVTLDDAPLEGALVEFFPVDEGSSASATTDAEGKFELIFAAGLEGAVVGDYTVAITKPERDEEKDKVEETLPIKYNHQTTLTATVSEAGENHFAFNLLSD